MYSMSELPYKCFLVKTTKFFLTELVREVKGEIRCVDRTGNET